MKGYEKKVGESAAQQLKHSLTFKKKKEKKKGLSLKALIHLWVGAADWALITASLQQKAERCLALNEHKGWLFPSDEACWLNKKYRRKQTALKTSVNV